MRYLFRFLFELRSLWIIRFRSALKTDGGVPDGDACGRFAYLRRAEDLLLFDFVLLLFLNLVQVFEKPDLVLHVTRLLIRAIILQYRQTLETVLEWNPSERTFMAMSMRC